jgi:type IV pilus assembly protein PilX
VVLLFLLIITIAATFGVRRATVAEGMSRNQLDYEVSRQAAEAALRDGERDLQLGMLSPGGDCTRGADRDSGNIGATSYWNLTCPRGQCSASDIGYYKSSNYAATPTVNPNPWWPDSKGGQWNDSRASSPPSTCAFNGGVPIGTFTGKPKVRGVARQPEYLLELMDFGEDRLYRITARGFGADLRTETVVQAFYRPPKVD